jgi:hypothetical protein
VTQYREGSGARAGRHCGAADPVSEPLEEVAASLHTSVPCLCDRAANGHAGEKIRSQDFCGRLSYRRDAVRGGVEGGHWDRPELRRTGMTHYLLTVHGPAERDEFGNYGSKQEMEEAFAATGAFNDKLHAAGYWVFAGGLAPASTATVVDGQGETPVMSDGPYLETKEIIGGFWVIDAPDLDVALKLAAEGSKACRGKVEVRPFDGLA